MTLSLNDYINAFNQDENFKTLADIGRGIEREALRVLPEGKLSQHGHYSKLGSALTHDEITTDYSETLLEFITPVSHSPEEAIASHVEFYYLAPLLSRSIFSRTASYLKSRKEPDLAEKIIKKNRQLATQNGLNPLS